MLSNHGKKLLFVIFFVSFTSFTLELLITRVFSILMWYHFASLAIGVAMLGLGGGGVFSYIMNKKINEGWLEKFFFFYLSSFLIIHLPFFYIHKNPDQLVPFLSFFHQPYFQPFQRGIFYSLNISMIVVIVIAYIVLMIPFFLAGAIISAIFRLSYNDAQRYYFADMSGAALASLFTAICLGILSPINLISFLPILGFCYLIYTSKKRLISIILLILSAALFIAGSYYKKDELPIARGKVAKDLIWVDWNAFSRVILYPLKGEERVNTFGQSPYYNGYVPEQWGLLVDDTGYTTASEYPQNEQIKDFFRWNIISLPYVINKDSALIIGPGGGKDVHCAISMGVPEKKITAVELNPLVVKAVDNVLGDRTGRLYSKVNTYISEGRSFLEKDSNFYDVLQATSVYGRIPPASGIFTFAEDHLYTLEAFKTYLSRLNKNGLLALSRFIYERTVPKMILLSINALIDSGLSNPNKSLFLAKERGIATLLVKKGEFDQQEIASLINFCNEKGFTVLFEPFGVYDNPYANLINSKEEWNKYDIPTDDKPFYYYNISNTEFFKTFFFKNDKFEEKGISVLKFFFFLSVLFVLIIIIFPMLSTVRKLSGLTNLVFAIYFFSLGIGYIMIEIIFIKSFSLFLETPIYSMIFVTGTLLFSSAIGAWYSKKGFSFFKLKKSFITIFALVILMTFIQNWIVNYLYLSIVLKVFITILILFVIGFFLGIPFPFILKYIGNKCPDLVPWGIALNSSSTVLGSFFCLIAVVNFGFRNSLLIAGIFYLTAFFMLFVIERIYEQN